MIISHIRFASDVHSKFLNGSSQRSFTGGVPQLAQILFKAIIVKAIVGMHAAHVASIGVAGLGFGISELDGAGIKVVVGATGSEASTYRHVHLGLGHRLLDLCGVELVALLLELILDLEEFIDQEFNLVLECGFLFLLSVLFKNGSISLGLFEFEH